jgi:hypothetical protein
MATKEPTNKEAATKNATAEATGQSVNLQLLPIEGSDQPLLANVTMVVPTAGVALLDFGFLEPRAMAVLNNMAREGKKVPERVAGRLAARIAISYEALATLHQQLGGVLQAVSRRENR